ncbi:hypothetical protein PY793_10025 [Acetobacter fabarum]|uniref:hypothetical protein n=1 Tax=Acetobacter fabarum TaxID=483199 RepID=UPI00312BA2CF
MDQHQLSERIKSIYGTQHGALKQAATEMPINYDNLRKMLSGARRVPAWIEGRLLEIERISCVAAPTPNAITRSARQDECHITLAPHLSNLLERAKQAGWSETEIITAIQAWSHRTTTAD